VHQVGFTILIYYEVRSTKEEHYYIFNSVRIRPTENPVPVQWVPRFLHRHYKHRPVNLTSHRPVKLRDHFTYLLTYLLTYLPTYLLTYIHTYILTHSTQQSPS
jgi:hypothetical protein